MPEAVWLESRRHSRLFYRRIIVLLGFGGRDVADGFEQPPVIEPVDPFEGGVFDSLEAAPWATPMDDLGLVKAIDRLGQGVVVAVADAADRRFDAGFGEPLGVFDRDILAAAITVIDKTAAVLRSKPAVPIAELCRGLATAAMSERWLICRSVVGQWRSC